MSFCTVTVTITGEDSNRNAGLVDDPSVPYIILVLDTEDAERLT